MLRDVRHLGADLRSRMDAIEREIAAEIVRTKRKAANLSKDEQLEQMRADVGADLRLGRVRSGRGAKIGARYRITADEVIVSATGPVPLVANPIWPHNIGPGRKRLSLPGGAVRIAVRHPGTPGKDTWNEGLERAKPKIALVIGRDIDGAVRRSFQKGVG